MCEIRTDNPLKHNMDSCQDNVRTAGHFTKFS